MSELRGWRLSACQGDAEERRDSAVPQWLRARKALSVAAVAVLAYQALMMAVDAVVSVAYALPSMTSGRSPWSWQTVTQAGKANNGVITAAIWVVGLAALALAMRRRIVRRDFWLGDDSSKRMGVRGLLMGMVMIMGVQAVFIVVQTVCAALGVTLSSPSSQSLSQSANGALAWCSIGLLGPIAEELLFRGSVLVRLRPYGRMFALVTSSVMFGIYHGDLWQGTVTACCALVFGYVAMEYSLLAAIVLHVFNNGVLGGASFALSAVFGAGAESWYAMVVIIVGLLGVLGFAVIRRAAIAAYCREHRSQHGTYLAWSSLGFVVFAVVNITMAVAALLNAAGR